MYTYYGIVNELLAELPEISKNYAEEIAWIKDTFKGQETGGQTMIIGDPYKFAILSGIFKEWNMDDTFCNGFLLCFCGT